MRETPERPHHPDTIEGEIELYGRPLIRGADWVEGDLFYQSDLTPFQNDPNYWLRISLPPKAWEGSGELLPPRSKEYMAELLASIEGDGSGGFALGASSEKPTMYLNDLSGAGGLKVQVGIDVEAMQAHLQKLYDSGEDLVEQVEDDESS